MHKNFVVCPKCEKESTIAEWNKTTDRIFPPVPGYEDVIARIDRLSKKDFYEYGFCVKDKPGSTEVTYYWYPECHKGISSNGLILIKNK